MIIITSVVLVFIILRFIVTVFNFTSKPELVKTVVPYNDLVSVLIPARNEEENILILLNSILEQDYQNYEVIIYNDESSDSTYKICSEFTASDPRFQIMASIQLPDGWIGKNYACNQLAGIARGKYYLFLDADVRVNKGLINSALHRMKLNGLCLLSLLPDQVMQTAGENTTVPLMNFFLLNMLTLQLIRSTDNPEIATACGQFMLFDGQLYTKNKWHEKAKDKVVEDGQIMKLVKAAGLKGELLLANGMINCRMYKNFRQAINGFSKNTLAAFNYNIWGLIIFVLLVIGGPIAVFATLNINLIFLMCGLIVLNRIMTSLLSGQNVTSNIILHPAQMINFIIIAFVSIQKHLTKTNEWKERRI